MIRRLLPLLLLLVCSACFDIIAAPSVSVVSLRVENLDSPLGIDTSEPRFSWIITAPKERDVVQTGYHLIVSGDRGEVWNTGRVESGEQLWVPYRGLPLKSGQHLTWRVKVYTNRGESDWSAEQSFSIGLLSESRWGGRWIGLEHLQPGERAGERHSRLAARYLRKEFDLTGKPVKRATAYVAGLGVYEAYVDGCRLGGDKSVLQPVPSDYRKTIYYNTYDITAALQGQSPRHCFAIVLGNGRYFAMRQDKPYKNTTFGLPKCRVNVVIEYEDGTTQRLVTDETWRVTAEGPIRANNEYDGEEYDARREMPGWNQTGFDDSHWQQAERTAIPTGTLRAQMMAGPALWDSSFVAKSIVERGTDTRIIDFGQNLAGWVSLLPQGKEGDTIRIRYAERLSADGSLYTDNLRTARSEDIFVCGKENREWHPSFVWHGFRYVEVTGKATDFKAHLVADAMSSTGHFACSDPTLTSVVQNAWWGIIDNYKGMPLDCPQRDERQPWLGDRTVGSLGESYLFDNERLYAKWVRDICEAQRSDGVIPDVAPAFWNYYTDDVTWPAALPFTCEMLWHRYGNTQPISDSYPSMKRWALHMLEENVRGDLVTKDKYGDWCMPPERLDLIHSQDPARQTDGTLIASAYMIRCLQLLGQFARLLDLSDDALYWQKRREIMTDAFNRRFLHVAVGSSPRPGHPLYPDSTFYDNNTATANVLPLAFGIVPDSLADEVAKQVVENIVVKNKCHVACGVIGISWLLRTLSDRGYGDVAWAIATQRSYPSWGYMVENGTTTIWELWNGDKADPAMNSGNHVMLLGDLLPWCFETLAGFRPSLLPGALSTRQQPTPACLLCSDSVAAHRRFVLRPSFANQGCSWVDAAYATPYGSIESRWKKTLQRLHWEIAIPCNTEAIVCLPSGEQRLLGSGSYTFDLDIPTADERILKDEFLYDEAPFASPHASTIVETRKGDLLCAYFGGTYERNPDCCIWVSIKKKGKKEWNAPILAADGDGLACWNPVLTEMPGGELWLFYKVGVNVAGWTGWLTKSKDGGRTWGKPEQLPDGFLGPIKNKPLLLGDKLLCGSSTESDGWRFHVEIYDLKTREWKYVGPIESTVAMKTDDNRKHPIDCIQPSFLQLKDGRLQVLMRSHNGFLATSFSGDQGETWTPVTLTDIPNNQSGTDAVTLSDGRHVLVYNNFQTLPGTKKGPRTPLSLAISDDDGLTWHHVLTLEDSPVGEYSYPAIIEGRDGKLHITYTWRRQRVAHKEVKSEEFATANGSEE